VLVGRSRPQTTGLLFTFTNISFHLSIQCDDLFLQVKLTQGNLTFMPTQDSVASQQELIVASEFFLCYFVDSDHLLSALVCYNGQQQQHPFNGPFLGLPS